MAGQLTSSLLAAPSRQYAEAFSPVVMTRRFYRVADKPQRSVVNPLLHAIEMFCIYVAFVTILRSNGVSTVIISADTAWLLEMSVCVYTYPFSLKR